MSLALSACIPMEVILDTPGIGQLAWQAALARDMSLLVVLTIMVALAGMMPLALEHRVPARKLAAASQQLALALRDLQSVALATGKTTHLFPQHDRYVTRSADAEKVITASTGPNTSSLPAGHSGSTRSRSRRSPASS